MRFLGLATLFVLATLVACSSDSDPTVTPTSAISVSTSTSTPAPAVETDRSFIALVDLATLQQTTLADGGGNWNSWFEDGGTVVNALVLAAGMPPRTARFALDGTVLLDSATELQVRVNADGSARAFGGETGDGITFKTFLEVNGAIVELEGDPTALPLGFSPRGDRLLSYTGVVAGAGEIGLSYSVHDLDGALLSIFVNRLSATSTSSSPTTWSPSGAYVATVGLDGLTLHEIETGGTFIVPVAGSTEWSPIEDALLLVAGASELQVLRMPDLDIVSIEVSTNGVTASFDPSGRIVAVSDAARGLTTIFDAVTGEQLMELGGVAEAFAVLGFDPVVMTDAGVAAILENSPGCGGVLIVHPALGNRGQCINGTNPRWSPDGSAVSYTRGSEIIVIKMDTLAELTVASEVPTGGTGTLARWNASGSHLLLEWPWGGGGWTDALP